MVLQVGDNVEEQARSTARRTRRGVIEGVVHGDSSPRYRIRWDDGHESMYTLAGGGLGRLPADNKTATGPSAREAETPMSYSFCDTCRTGLQSNVSAARIAAECWLNRLSQVVPSKDRQALAGDTEHRAELRSRLELDAHPRSSIGSRQRGAQRSISDTDALTAIEVRPAALEALVGRRADDHGQVAIGALRLRLGIPRPGPRSAVPSSIPAGICTQRLFGPHSAAARALVAGVVDDRAVSVAGGANGDLLHVRDGWS